MWVQAVRKGLNVLNPNTDERSFHHDRSRANLSYLMMRVIFDNGLRAVFTGQSLEFADATHVLQISAIERRHSAYNGASQLHAVKPSPVRRSLPWTLVEV